MEFKISASIVLYKNSFLQLDRLLNSFSNMDVILILIDNSPTNELETLLTHFPVLYIHNPENPGFGSGHNQAIRISIEMGCDHHFIVNPDIYFINDIITPMVNYISKNQNIGMIMPQILYLDGSIQYLPKLLPNPFSILIRKFMKPFWFHKRYISSYELRDIPQDMIYNTPVLSGCFVLLNLNAVKDVGMFDDSYFMYFEDWDLSRRIHEKYQTLYYPIVSVYHEYHSGANKSLKLFFIYIKSAIVYFNKWGWFFDKKSIKANKKTLSQFQ
jgi:GT2 family glycosyltransferase